MTVWDGVEYKCNCPDDTPNPPEGIIDRDRAGQPSGVLRELAINLVMVFSYLGNPGVGSLHCVRRAVDKGIPQAINLTIDRIYDITSQRVSGQDHSRHWPGLTRTL
jgi:hypothetical protein